MLSICINKESWWRELWHFGLPVQPLVVNFGLTRAPTQCQCNQLPFLRSWIEDFSPCLCQQGGALRQMPWCPWQKRLKVCKPCLCWPVCGHQDYLHFFLSSCPAPVAKRGKGALHISNSLASGELEHCDPWGTVSCEATKSTSPCPKWTQMLSTTCGWRPHLPRSHVRCQV